RGGVAVGSAGRAVTRRALAVRLPQWPDARAVVVTALVVGLLTVGLGWAVLAGFDRLFGVKSGGVWGVFAFALLAAAGFAVGRTLLRWFGYDSAGPVAGLGQLVGVVALLITLPSSDQSLWALLIVPAVALVSYLVAHGAIRAANAEEASSTEPVSTG
ncbi:MAG: hypothetical protein QM597_01995, partial [Aeromicrobium sp.]|uniref:hypothetical protein n=1 Tax=Aeromicrobium sp. TaxID=1871063 RepID=UPI0039E72B00